LVSVTERHRGNPTLDAQGSMLTRARASGSLATNAVTVVDAQLELVTLLPAAMITRLCERLFGSSELPASLSSAAIDATASTWRALALDPTRSPAQRCFAACQLDDFELWARLYADPCCASMRDFIRMCFPAYRLWPSTPGALRLSARSFDSRRFELEAMLRAFARDDGERGRVYWSALKRRYPKWKHDPELGEIFAPALERGRSWITRDDLHAAPSCGAFDLLGSVFRNAALIRQASTFGGSAPQLLLTFHSSAATEAIIDQDPRFRAQLGRFQLSVVLGYEPVAEPDAADADYPSLRNMVAWARVDTRSIPGAWILEELQSVLVQHAEDYSSIFGNDAALAGLSAAELSHFRAKIRALFDGWELSVLCTVLASARENQVADLYMRRATEVRASSHSMRLSTARRLYGQLPRELGFVRRDYVDPASGRIYPLLHRRP
jgi:hypothetical protein